MKTLEDTEGDVYDTQTLISEKDYGELQVQELYRDIHPTFILWWQVYCGFWFLFNALGAIMGFYFGFTIVLWLFVPSAAWYYLIGFSRVWPRLYMKNKHRFIYIGREFAKQIHKPYSYKQRIGDWGYEHVKRWKAYKEARKEYQASQIPVPKPPRKDNPPRDNLTGGRSSSDPLAGREHAPVIWDIDDTHARDGRKDEGWEGI